MSPVDAWLLVAEVAAVLVLFWISLNWAFDLIERAHQRLREEAEAGTSLEDSTATRERGH